MITLVATEFGDFVFRISEEDFSGKDDIDNAILSTEFPFRSRRVRRRQETYVGSEKQHQKLLSHDSECFLFASHWSKRET